MSPPAAEPRWWSIRPAQSTKPSTYTCPFCRGRLPALSEHFLIAPEDDRQKRRHAHTKCVLKAREAGRLPTRDEWAATQPRPDSALSRLRARLFGKTAGR